MNIGQLAASPCSCPKAGLEPCLRDFAALGYAKFELFTEWAESRADIEQPPARYAALAAAHGMAFTSMHLPVIGPDLDASVARSVRAASFARALGARVVIYKARTRELYIAGARRFLDETAALGITPVLQNHVGTPITTLEDYAAVIDGIGDERMKALLEVGMFHSVGVPWQRGYEFLKGRMALVHIKDQVGDAKVPFGEGEVDLRGLFGRLSADGYAGEVVVEMEVCRDDPRRTLELLGAARAHCGNLIKETA
jgi:sugar phosphate isomerase/epimerase